MTNSRNVQISTSYLFNVLFKEALLEALFEFGLAGVPDLSEVLAGPVQVL